MKDYKLTIRTITETMLGSGESLPGLIDNDIRYDEYGIPFMNAKTLKGHIREQMELIREAAGEEFASVDLAGLLGSSDEEGDKKQGKLHFSIVRPSDAVCRAIEKAVQKGTTTPEEILDALTVTNTYTRIGKNGIVEHGSLRTARMFKKGLVLVSVISADDLTGPEYELLNETVMALQHIGTMKSKGKGLVECSLEEIGKEESHE
jgi:CRISPR-associated protein Csx10